MTSNSKFHIQSILFAVIILFFASLSSGGQPSTEVAQISREAQLTATVVDAAIEVVEEEVLPVQEAGDRVEQVAAHEAAALGGEPSPSSQISAPTVTAAAFLAQEVGGSEIVGSYQADYRWPIASITKLMTALVALETIGGEQEVIISQVAVDTEGDAGGFTAGEAFTVNDLIVAMMTVSSNDAAAAVADYVGTPRFYDLMQEKAYALGLTNTSFIDATGLSYLNQSTATDVAKLVAHIHERYPEVLEISTRATNRITEIESGLSRSFKNINAFAGTAGFKGGKTGFTDESRGNLVSLFSYEGKVYTLVVFGTVDRFAETRKLLAWMKTSLSEELND